MLPALAVFQKDQDPGHGPVRHFGAEGGLRGHQQLQRGLGQALPQPFHAREGEDLKRKILLPAERVHQAIGILLLGVADRQSVSFQKIAS